MNKERLEKLLNNSAIQHKEILWAIQYAKELTEKVEELEEQVNSAHTALKVTVEELVAFAIRNDRYREAIEYVMTTKVNEYASVKNVVDDIKFILSETLEESQ